MNLLKENWFKVGFLIVLVIAISGVFYWFWWQSYNIKKSDTGNPGAYQVNRLFQLSELYCPENEDGGRLSHRQCYLPVPCYESGARLKNITCD